MLVIILGAAEYNFSFVPHFTRFHWSNNAHVKLLYHGVASFIFHNIPEFSRKLTHFQIQDCVASEKDDFSYFCFAEFVDC